MYVKYPTQRLNRVLSRIALINWELLGDGDGIHWPEIDEDLSIAGLLSGTH